MKHQVNIPAILVIAYAVASIVVSCKSKIGEADSLVIEETPLQTIENMFAIQSTNGELGMRLEAPVMKHYENDTSTYDSFPLGISVFGYTDEGLLETVIVSDKAKHVVSKRKGKEDVWSAYGNVIIHNVIKQETMETDTIYWDQNASEIYTDCYVKMYSPSGFMQGYGMRSDDRARNSILHKPFDSYGVTTQDTTKVVIDSVNFIGPFPKK